jgi:hypothetical protein
MTEADDGRFSQAYGRRGWLLAARGLLRPLRLRCPLLLGLSKRLRMLLLGHRGLLSIVFLQTHPSELGCLSPG